MNALAAIRRCIVAIAYPRLGTCYRCGRGWGDKDTWLSRIEHSTKFSATEGCFPLCEKCWSRLSVDDRLPYYRRLWDSWNHGGFWVQYHDGSWHEWPRPVSWPTIESAVREERP